MPEFKNHSLAWSQVLQRILDLVFHLPSGLIDRRERPRLDQLPETGIVTVEVTVGKHRPPPPHLKRLPYRVECFDDTGALTLVFFHAFADHLQRMLPPGETRFISGAIDWFQGSAQIAHPDAAVHDEFADDEVLLSAQTEVALLPPVSGG